jgi:hypothetical protein
VGPLEVRDREQGHRIAQVISRRSVRAPSLAVPRQIFCGIPAIVPVTYPPRNPVVIDLALEIDRVLVIDLAPEIDRVPEIDQVLAIDQVPEMVVGPTIVRTALTIGRSGETTASSGVAKFSTRYTIIHGAISGPIIPAGRRCESRAHSAGQRGPA